MERSNEIDKLNAAIFELTQKIEPVFKAGKADIRAKDGGKGYEYKFAKLENVQEAIQEPLRKCGLMINQPLFGRCGVETVITHVESGQYISFVCEMQPQFAGNQASGSTISYTRRIAIISFFNLRVTDIDDDGKRGDTDTEKALKKAFLRPIDDLKEHMKNDNFYPNIQKNRVYSIANYGGFSLRDFLGGIYDIKGQTALMAKIEDDFETYRINNNIQ